jgi:MoaA/NifB/PqqE/SkfB family radical SAM enzyme
MNKPIQLSENKLKEKERRNWLKDYKPQVYDKVIKFQEKISRGEAIPIIQFQYNYVCNFQCEHCCTKKMQEIQFAGETQKQKRYFKLDDVRELSRQADNMGLSTFVITGGEPLLFKDLDELVKAINPSKFWIVMDSNGWLLDDQKARYLKSIGIDKIQLSLDGADAQTHDTFRRQDGSWERCIKAIEACKKADLHIILSTVVWKGRAKSQEFHEFMEMAKKLGVGIYVAYAKPIGAYEERYDQMITAADEAAILKFEKQYDVFTHLTPAYGIDIGCIAVKRMVSITRFGDVMPCPYIHVSLGNFFKEPLQDIINRGLNIKWFDPKVKMPCLTGMDKSFIDQVLSPTYGDVEIPVSYEKVFKLEDYVNPSKEKMLNDKSRHPRGQ